jgi:uncharacterized DUF497 family protein
MSIPFLRFEFDPDKAAINLNQHGVSFDEAVTSFYDPNAASWHDVDHSQPGDDRFVNLGLSTSLRLLFVVHNEEDGLIRIISARPATTAERDLYEEA